MLRYLALRFLAFVETVFIGMTAVFVITRLNPTDPVDSMLARLTSMGRSLSDAEYASLKASLTDAFGLSGPIWRQYVRFIYHNLIQFDFGPSFASYPTPVIDQISRAMPWTVGLLFTSTLFAWVIGNLVGLYVGLNPRRASARLIEGAAIILYPIPYYMMALLLIILFTYIWPLFPLSTSIEGEGWSWQYVWSILYNSTLPGLSIALSSFGWWVISMKALASGVNEEDYVRFARLRGVPQRVIATKYVLRNALLPQITVLAIQLGLILSGSILAEILFQYPGVGLLLYRGVTENDYNLLLGTIELSIIAVAGATLLIDVAYPLIDPRIRRA